MGTVKRIVCLANSRKINGRCVAGKELLDDSPGPWVRPVSAREHQEVSEYERQYADGSDPRNLDILDVPLLHPQPHDYQQENWLLDPKAYWEKHGRIRWQELALLADTPGRLWVDGYSTYSGRNDTIPLEIAQGLRSSLLLIPVDRVTLAVFAPGEAFGNPKRRVQGQFHWSGREYRLWVTHPRYERDYLARPDGRYDLGRCYLTLSLGEPYNGHSHKLIAAILEPEGQQTP